MASINSSVQPIQLIQAKNLTVVEQAQSAKPSTVKGDASLPLDRSVISTLKGAGSGALAATLPTLPIAIYMLKAASSAGGTAGIGQATVGLGLGAAGALGGLVGGAVAVNTTDSHLKGALFGGAAAALVGAAVTGIILKCTLPIGGAMNPLPAMGIAAAAFGITGAIGGGMGASFAQRSQ